MNRDIDSTIIEFKKISLKIGNFFLNNLSFKIFNDGITFFMGANGSGKSICLKLILGMLNADKGKILINKKDKNKIGYVSQKTVFLRRSVYENLYYSLKVIKYPEKEISNRINEILSIANFKEFINHSARNLSTGQQQLLAVIRAFIIKPNILLLDEPCSNLDPASARIIENLLKRILAFNVKIIIVTHDYLQVKRLADNILFLHNGKITENTESDQFFKLPKSQEAIDYLNGIVLN